MSFKRIKKLKSNQDGSVLLTSVIFIMIVMGFTFGYYRTVMNERIGYLSRLAKVQAYYNAYDGLGQNYAYVSSGTFNDTIMEAYEIESMSGGVLSVEFSDTLNMETQRTNFNGESIGYATYPGFDGEPIVVTDTARISYRPVGFEEYMYFSNEETPGGGPWLGQFVRFGGTDVLEGKVFSNDNIILGAPNGCPQIEDDPDDAFFTEIGSAGQLEYNGCTEASLFGTGDDEIAHHDSLPKIEWPPFVGQDQVRNNANYIFYANQFIHPIGSPDHDQLVMTDIEFFEDYFVVQQWKYIKPPATSSFAFNFAHRDTLKAYSPMRYAQMFDASAYGPTTGAYVSYRDWPSFDYDNQKPSSVLDYVTYQTIYTNDAVIWIEGGQVRVHGLVRGRYTVATSGPQLYRMHYNNTTIDTLFTNIWLTDNIIYKDSYPGGATRWGSPNRMGLLSGANIIVANTPANGKRNMASGSDIIINAAMIAMDESFVVQYWQNSTADYNFTDGNRIKGDKRGVSPFTGATGNNDIRGEIVIYGSVIQAKRGYVKRNLSGPYNISPGIGYDKDYNYDYNLREFPPPHWPSMRTTDGAVNLTLASYGDK